MVAHRPTKAFEESHPSRRLYSYLYPLPPHTWHSLVFRLVQSIAGSCIQVWNDIVSPANKDIFKDRSVCKLILSLECFPHNFNTMLQ